MTNLSTLFGSANEMIVQTISNGDTDHVPSSDIVFDELAGKAATSQKLDDFGTPDDNTDLNANTTNHGLVIKAVAPASGLRNVVGIDNAETAYTNKALFDATSPSTQALGDSAAVGTAMVAARRDHKHAMPTTGTTAADNDATTSLATNAFAKSQDAVLARLPDQAVNMTAAASGSSGITIADNGNIDFGTGNFTLVWRGSLPDWTSSYVSLMVKISGTYIGYMLRTNASGGFRLTLCRNDSGLNIDTTVSHELINNTTHEIVFFIVRETVADAGSVACFIDGVQLGNAIPITAADTASISNSGPLYVLGDYTGSSRTAGTCSFAATYNRALTAAEVLDLYRNGIAYADKWGSQTSLITGNNSTFSGANQWVNYNLGYFDSTSGGVLTIQTNGAGQFCRLPIANAPMVVGKKYRIDFTSSGVVGTWNVKDFESYQFLIPDIVSSGTFSYEFVGQVGNTGGLMLYSDDGTLIIDNITLYEIGATLALEPEGIQNNLWYDSSSNALNASYPAAGWSLTRKLNVPRTNTGQPAFFARLSSTLSDCTGDGTAVYPVFDIEIYDQGDMYNNSTGYVTAPVAGKYDFCCIILMQQLAASHTSIVVALITTGGTYHYYDNLSLAVDRSIVMPFKGVPMSANDTARINITVSNGSKVVDFFGNAGLNSFFSCHLAF